MTQEKLLEAYKNMSDKFDEFTQTIRKTVPVNSLPPHCRMGCDAPGTHISQALQPPKPIEIPMSGECEKCGDHALECECDNLKKILPAYMIERIEDIGRAQEKLKGILNHEIFDNLSKHDTYWHSKNDLESEKLDDLRRKISYLKEMLGDLWDILRKEE